MSVVLLPSSLRQYVDQQARVEVAGETISAVLDNLVSLAPEMRNHLFAAKELRNFVVVSVNGSDIRRLQGLATGVAPADEIRILSSIAGG
jgi:molybdopterin synthase sulfur carrier subunit